ncbi:MAG TPA: hypothetical protein VGT60_11195 [Candidatus Limnocylindria bacterium]|nr:hypothetical protein [Candidatus Limnocylindria bacterium]
MRSRRATELIALGRHLGTATLAGAVSGIVVGGLLGRVVMRIAGFMAGPGLAGVSTANGNQVGQITFAGTAAIVVFVGLSGGLIGGVLYGVIEPWLRPLRPWHGLAYGAALLASSGFLVLDPANLDFVRFGSAPVNVAMFAALFVIFGVVIAWLFDRLRASIAGTSTRARVAEVLAFLALIPGVIATVLVLVSVSGLAEPLFPLALVLSLLIAAIVRARALPLPIGYAALGTTILLGALRTIGGLPGILSGF